MDYVEEPAEVCVPTLETKCDQEDGGQTLELRTEEKCQDVVRTVCVERHNVVDNEVCAYSYTLHPVPTEAKLVEPHWTEVCLDRGVGVRWSIWRIGHCTPNHSATCPPLPYSLFVPK